MWYDFKPYVPVAQRRAQAAKEMAKRAKKGRTAEPVVLEGRTIAHTFWGKAWVAHMEAMRDYANRLERGRTYVRNGSVVDLKIEPGRVNATVSGSELYEISIGIDPLPAAEWASIKKRCAGQVGSLVDLLSGKLAASTIAVVTAEKGGLFPSTKQVKMSCDCPDGASMCKHLAAVLYGVGSRLDTRPELLFVLRKVDHLELIEAAVSEATATKVSKRKTVDDLAGVFGIDLAGDEAPKKPRATKKPAAISADTKAKPTTKKPTAAPKKPTTRKKKDEEKHG